MATKSVKSPPRPWYAEGLCFECQPDCGACCTNHDDYAYVYLEGDDLERLASHLGLTAQECAARYTEEDDEFRILRMDEPDCPFLDGRGCSVYPARPHAVPDLPLLAREPELTEEVEAAGSVLSRCRAGCGSGSRRDSQASGGPAHRGLKERRGTREEDRMNLIHSSRFPAYALLLCVVVSCSGTAEVDTGQAAPAPGRGGTAVIGSISDVDSWNEYVSRQSFAGNLLRRIYLRLAQEQGDDQEHPQTYGPLLAESWSFSEDGLALTFTLRDARWSDGAPITSRDVRFTWQAQTSEHVPWIGAASKTQIRDVEIVDDRHVTFHFRTRYPFQLADAVDGGILPEHVFGEIPFEQWAEGQDWSEASVGSGPFLLERHARGQEIVLTRNPHYFRQGYPLLDRVVVRVVPDVSNLLTQLLAGEIDYLEGLSPREAAALRSGDRANLIEFDWPSYEFLGWNGSRTPFDNPSLRQAMTLALDREALVDDLLYGHGTVSKGPLLSFWWGSDRDLRPWPHDPDRAREILAELGYGAAGGKTLEVELLTNAGNQLREDMLVKIQDQLSRVGIRARVSSLEMRALRQRVASGDYDVYLGGWVYSVKDLESIFGSAYHPPKGVNVVFYSSDDVDALFRDLGQATSWQSMKPLLDTLQERIHEDQPYSFLCERKRLAAYGPRLNGVVIDVPSDPLARLESFRVQ